MKDFLHIFFAGAIAALAAYFNVLLIPLIVLVAVMSLDYITGMVSAKKHSEISSRVGIIGIVKKVCYLILVAVGIVVDYLLSSALVHIGVNSPINYLFGLMVIIWLIINELISILENLGEMDVPMPNFLVSTIKTLKRTVEDTAETGKHFKDEGD